MYALSLLSLQPTTMLRRTIAPLLQRGIACPPRHRLLATTTRLAYSSGRDGHAGPVTTDPGYATTDESVRQAPPAKDAAPSVDSDPFPLPFDPRLDGLSLSSKHQLENLVSGEEAYPLRVPGREPGKETREVKLARLRYQIRHRGILETDLLLSTFAKEHLDSLAAAELDEFDQVSSPCARTGPRKCTDSRRSSSTSQTGTFTTG